MPEWVWWIIGGVGVLAALYLLVSLIIYALLGSFVVKIFDIIMDVFDD